MNNLLAKNIYKELKKENYPISMSKCIKIAASVCDQNIVKEKPVNPKGKIVLTSHELHFRF